MYDDSLALSLGRFLKSKKEAVNALKEMILELETVQNCKVKKLVVKRVRSDNGKEFMSKDLRRWLAERGITQEFSAPYSP